MVLFAAAPGQSTTHRGSYPFAVQFPASVEGGTDALPPSYTLYQPGVMTEISYSFRVDIVRKGLRRHEKYALPRTHSLAPVVLLPTTHDGLQGSACGWCRRSSPG